ncbi:MAG: riboflavin synthase [Gammaproteobacteria bacterium]|jgi:riboflavin synthase|nr:riboflavin synthase [Gammaproteobacteria bacterium]MBT5222020.1 riboflavin synthase [Gammaproteobacteria bacterium]MBT5825814.1 riboflavin synthase [Gammaproteobacteria bacterium]MBT5967198.1 riboflavin synthase [Gammaproteobacteria bacterium]MBT6418805.1 riboflavin synthase [Gammaproteobacteria bacterium]
MFTGIILAIGKITQIQQKAGDVRLSIDTGKLSLADAHLGDSIAVNGICLTAVELTEHGFVADVSNETLARTNLKQVAIGTPVNLELALMPQSRMGGHIVSGHVDGLANLLEKKPDGRSIRFKFRVANELAKYIAEKGSICINGISLTVNSVNGAEFSVNIVPHTLKETSLGFAAVNDKVNIEVDLLARYMERLMKGDATTDCKSGVTENLLKESGFI